MRCGSIRWTTEDEALGALARHLSAAACQVRETVTDSAIHRAHRHIGHVVGDGHCVALVREVCGLPPTAHWRAGGPALEAEPGTPIATFNADGRYGNHTSGASHAAILLEATGFGLRVIDQWIGHPVAERLIRFRDGKGPPADDADRYSVVDVV